MNNYHYIKVYSVLKFKNVCHKSIAIAFSSLIVNVRMHEFPYGVIDPSTKVMKLCVVSG